MGSKFSIIWLNETDSTNNEVSRRIDRLDNMSVIAARNQTAGRGQRGNRWYAAPGENLTFSILLRHGRDGLGTLETGKQFLLSARTALAIMDLFRKDGISALIKWPNDIYVADRKLSGILIENVLAGDMVSASIVGIGMNLNQRSFSPGILNPISAALVTGREYDTRSVLDDFLECFARRLEDNEDKVMEDYAAGLYRKDEFHDYSDASTGDVFSAAIRGVAPDGRLAVETPDGSMKYFYFKEIGYLI